MNRSRPNKVTFRLSDTKLQELRARVKESGFNEQQFLIRAVLSNKMIEKETLQELIFHLRKIGVNCNQIAKSCNSGNVAFETDRIDQVITTLEYTCQSLRRLV